ncbi:MAG: glycosyltransferase family 4 protein [Algoriphagus sp.]|nr:glycosyltransferase family 4 protein [Algoriphagus sp.]
MEKKLKAAVLLTNSFLTSYGGIGPFVRNLDIDLCHYFDLQYFFLPERLEKVRLVPHRLLFVFFLLWKFRQLKQNDVIISHSPEGSLVATYTFKPLVHVFHGNTNPMDISRFRFGKYLSWVFDYIHKVIYAKAFLLYSVGEKRPGAKKFVNPIAHEVQIKKTSDREGFIFAGRLEKGKCIPKIIEAYSWLPAQIKANHKLYIAGSGSELPNLKELVKKISLVDKVVFLGNMDNRSLIEITSSRKLLLMASAFEGFPMAIAEAFSVGIPVLSTAVGDIPQFVKSGFCGLLYPVEFNPKDYAKGIESILEDYTSYAESALVASRPFDAKEITRDFAQDILTQLKLNSLSVLAG